mmetsp:Transcript_20539/g.37321  ORF Transcript_20539/g.37321 Transcript_20539/m.37321 type:complete len:315 (+) Transcript_20539:928-1872(+)
MIIVSHLGTKVLSTILTRVDSRRGNVGFRQNPATEKEFHAVRRLGCTRNYLHTLVFVIRVVLRIFDAFIGNQDTFYNTIWMGPFRGKRIRTSIRTPRFSWPIAGLLCNHSWITTIHCFPYTALTDVSPLVHLRKPCSLCTSFDGSSQVSLLLLRSRFLVRRLVGLGLQFRILWKSSYRDGTNIRNDLNDTKSGDKRLPRYERGIRSPGVGLQPFLVGTNFILNMIFLAKSASKDLITMRTRTSFKGSSDLFKLLFATLFRRGLWLGSSSGFFRVFVFVVLQILRSSTLLALVPKFRLSVWVKIWTTYEMFDMIF